MAESDDKLFAKDHPPATDGFLAKMADLIYRNRWKTVIAWLVIFLVVGFLGSTFSGKFRADYSSPGSESKAAAELIEERFPGNTGDTIDVVWTAPAGATSAETKADVAAFLKQLEAQPGVSKNNSLKAARVSPDGKIAVINVPLSKRSWDFEIAESEKIADLAKAANARNGGTEIELAGGMFQSGDTPTWPAYVAALIILLIAFGSVVASGLPIITAVVGLGVGSMLVMILASLTSVPDWAPAVADLLAIGVGIDYALLVLTRFRDSLDISGDVRSALIEAVTTAGRSVLVAGSTVIIAVMGLFLVQLDYMNGVAMSTSITILIVMLTSLTLLPALLALLGTRVNKLKLPGVASAHERRERENDPNHLPLAARWSKQVQKRPWPLAIITTAVLLGLSAPLVSMNLGFPDASNEATDSTTYKSYKLIEKGFGAGANGPLIVAVNLDKSAGSDAGNGPVLEKLQAGLEDENHVVSVAPPVLNKEQNAAMVIVTPDAAPQSKTTGDLVEKLRSDTIPTALAGTGAVALIGGATPSYIDQSNYLSDHVATFIIGVVLLSLIILLLAFRSPIIAIKAGIMNLLSVGASFGVISLAAQGGTFGQLLGIDREVPIAPFVPVMMFAILFGLSMDYEVFLMSRIREEYLKGRETHEAVTIGLARTARVITAAAAIMICVFLSFALSPAIFLRLMGIGMATAVLVDATLVRMILVPAVLQILGDRNWWIPAWLDKLLPHWELEAKDTTPATSEV
ncbi:MAG: MMPL family transporter [Thermoleophilaceae bacterium]|nr:MMPL family transporter [Thermoleophilaceae bacterium]